MGKEMPLFEAFQSPTSQRWEWMGVQEQALRWLFAHQKSPRLSHDPSRPWKRCSQSGDPRNPSPRCELHIGSSPVSCLVRLV